MNFVLIKKTLGSLCIAASALLLVTTTSSLVGCDRKETVVDVETPAGEVEVERDKDTGETTVDFDDN